MAQTEHEIRAYLLGQLSEADEEQFELRLLTDPDFAEEYDIVVNEITDDYVADRFEGEELKLVEEHFFRSTQRRDKLKFALALKERKQQKDIHKRRVFPPYLAIAASILVVVGAGFGIWRVFFYQSDLNKGLVALRSAFSKERPLEARLSDFNYAPLANQRGGPAKTDYFQRDLAANLLLKEVSDHPSAKSHHALGQYYLAEHKFEPAIDQFRAALGLDPQNAKIHCDLGAALLEEAKVQSSGPDKGKELETFARSLEELNRALELNSSLLEAHFNRALVSQYMMLPRQAEAAWKDYLQRDGNSPWADEARRNLKLLEESGRQSSPNAENAIRNFLDARRSQDDKVAWEILRQNYTSAGNQVTNSLLDSLLESKTSSASTNPNSPLSLLSYLAKLELSKAGDRFTADLVRQYERASPKLRPLLADAHQHMKAGYALFTKSKFAEAIAEYNDAKLGYERAGDTVETAFVDYQLAHCYVFLPDLDKAEHVFKRLAANCEANAYRWLFAQCLFDLAHVSADSREYSKALDYSNRALAKFEQAGDVNGVLKCLTQLADVNQWLNRIDRSLEYLSRGLALASETSAAPAQRWGILVQMALDMNSVQLPTVALCYQKEALSLALETGIPLYISRSYGYLGSAYAALKRYPEAISEATQAFEIGRGIPESTGGLEIMAKSSQQLGDIRRQAGECDKAVEAYDKSILLYEKLNLDYYQYVAHKGKLLCFTAGSDELAVCEELQTVLDLSKLYRSRITVESQRNSFFDMEQSVYDLAIHYEFAKDPVKAFEYSEESRARSLLDSVQMGAKVEQKGDGPDLNLAAVANPMSLAEVQKRMPGTTQILQYILIAPAEPFLDKSKFLCIVPDKVLNRLAYGALVSPATARYLIEDYDIGIALSSSTFADLSAAAERKAGPFEEKLLIAGDPRFNKFDFASLADLPSAAREAQAVSAFYNKRRVLLRGEATETAIRSEIQSADVVHLATHYILNSRSEMLSGFPLTPERSHLAGQKNSDGFLQSYEIYGLNLSRPRLVILSACQTGVEQQYSGEGAISAARPFLAMRVPVVVASLWPVDSESSAELLVNFHRHRIRDTLPVAQALRRAQIEMIQGQDKRYRHPYYWASFLALGGRSPY